MHFSCQLGNYSLHASYQTENHENGYGDERTVMTNFETISSVNWRLSALYGKILRDGFRLNRVSSLFVDCQTVISIRNRVGETMRRRCHWQIVTTHSLTLLASRSPIIAAFDL